MRIRPPSLFGFEASSVVARPLELGPRVSPRGASRRPPRSRRRSPQGLRGGRGAGVGTCARWRGRAPRALEPTWRACWQQRTTNSDQAAKSSDEGARMRQLQRACRARGWTLCARVGAPCVPTRRRSSPAARDATRRPLCFLRFRESERVCFLRSGKEHTGQLSPAWARGACSQARCCCCSAARGRALRLLRPRGGASARRGARGAPWPRSWAWGRCDATRATRAGALFPETAAPAAVLRPRPPAGARDRYLRQGVS